MNPATMTTVNARAMSQQNVRCCVCHCTKQPLLCANCINEASIALRKQLGLRERRSERDTLGHQLEDKIQDRKKFDRESRQTRLGVLTQSLAYRATHAEKRLKTLQEQIEKLHVENWRKLNGLSTSTKRWMTASSAFHSKSSFQQHQYEMTLLKACESETHEEIKHGLIELTRSLEMNRTSTGVEILGRVLPRMMHPMPSMTPEMPNHIGAVLGYVYMILDRLGQSMSIPLMHVGRFECSTSHIMRPERIFDRYRSPRWMKHGLYCTQDGNWDNVVDGARLMKRSLRWIATSMKMKIDDSRISLFDLLLIVLTQAAQRTGSSPLEAVAEHLVDEGVSKNSDDDDWCELDSMILPPPPSDDVAIAQYETAITMGQDKHLSLRDSFRILKTGFSALEWLTPSLTHKTGVWPKNRSNVS